MRRILARIVINMIALWLTARLIDGIVIGDDLLTLLLVAVVFGLVNAFIRPIVKLLTLPINLITLGLFTLVINALMLMLTAWLLSDALTIEGGLINSFFTALIGSVIISIVSTVLNWLLPGD
jgi:putative membrane protein